MKIILYSTHCPQCNVLKQKLDKKNISYEEINNIDTMIAKGYMSAPILEIDGQTYEFKQAIKWVNSIKNNKGE